MPSLALYWMKELRSLAPALLKKPRLPPEVPSHVTIRPARPEGAPRPAFSVKEATPGMAGAGTGAAVVVVVKAAVRRVRVVERRVVFISGCVCACVCVCWLICEWEVVGGDGSECVRASVVVSV